MGTKKKFTPEELKHLQANPYTLRVTADSISYTLAFKEAFWALSLQGYTGTAAFRKLGYNTEALGFERIHNTTKRIRREARSPEGFHEGARGGVRIPGGGNSQTEGASAPSDEAARRMMYGDNVIEKHGINRDSTGDREKTRYLCGKQGIFTRDRALIRPGFIRQLETRASTRSASFFHALGSPGRPHNGGGEAGAYRTRNGAKPLKQGHLRAKRGPLGPSRKSQQQTKRTGFAAHGHSIAETAPEGKRASCANGALIRA